MVLRCAAQSRAADSTSVSSNTGKALQTLVNTLDDPTATAAAKVSAAIAVLDRGWGKPTERHEHVSLNAVAELSDDELRNAIALLRATASPASDLGDLGLARTRHYLDPVHKLI
jgi:hypothetical protein